VRWRSLSIENRAYLPAADLAQKLRDTQTPLFGVESQKSLAEFDILGFSLSYELGATNILEMLTLAGIPLTWRERAAVNYPLIFAGGQTATSNPEPYADFFDFIALADRLLQQRLSRPRDDRQGIVIGLIRKCK
jgi:radical SAM superfamily enzyme YgiQ (UPF0313 family)